MKTVNHTVDVCVVGGGLSGLCAAVAAARHGASVLLMHDRAVLGGNASSEIRVWVQGALGSWDRSVRETGIVEEIMLDCLRYNPQATWSAWDAVLYNIAKAEANLTLLLNCACIEGEAANNKLQSVKGWQSPSQTWHQVRADVFVDASGDSILGQIAGADMVRGHDARGQYQEPDAPETAKPTTLGNSIVFIWRDMGRPAPFVKPPFAYSYPTEEEAPKHYPMVKLGRAPNGGDGCFYAELGGKLDTVHDDEAIRDELLKVGLGIIDHLKNHGDHGVENLALEWFGMVPGKRESWRLLGDHVFSQNDAVQDQNFEDVVAFGGWPIDDHHPDGSLRRDEAESDHVWRPVQCPYGIPFRSLYSRNVENLFMAGRNISASHLGLCTTRVMATCAVIGQAAGTAAAVATKHDCSPRQVGQRHLTELQHALQDDDCWLPGLPRQIAEVSRTAALTASSGDPQDLRNGHDRPDEDRDQLNAWCAAPGQWAEYRFDIPKKLTSCRLVFDSDLKRKWANMPTFYPRDGWDTKPPQTLVKAFRILAESTDGQWREVAAMADNSQRLVKLDLDVETRAVRLVLDQTWGNNQANVFAWDVS